MSDQMFAVATVPRGCGKSRTKGGTYWETSHSPHGQPIEFWLTDPPVKIDPDDLGISTQGVKLLEANGVYHVLDWIGGMYYPNVTDFIEEARRFGVSRKCELHADDYALLSPESKLICIHSAAYLDEPEIHWGARIGMGETFFAGKYKWTYCPKEIVEHDLTKEQILNSLAVVNGYTPPMCAGLWWEDCMFVEPIEDDLRLGIRTMPAFRYRCASSPASPKEVTPRSPAIFAAFPFGRMAIVEDPEGGEHLTKLEKINLPEGMLVEVVEA